LPWLAAIGARMSRLRAALARHRTVVVVGAIVVVAAIAAAAAFASDGKHHRSSAATAATTTSRPNKVVVKRVIVARCPLTNLQAPFNIVPRRPALLVKIGNEPGSARPQSGLNEADVVFDTPAEGFVMRYMAVYQCGDANAIGPMRSVRWVDYHLSPQFSQSILAFAGGIMPNQQAVAATPSIYGANVLGAQSAAGYRTSDRSPPDNLYASTGNLYSLFRNATTPPPPIFDYSASLPAGASPAASAALNFSGGTDVVWLWQPATKTWLHTYAGTPDIDRLNGAPVTTKNIVIEIVHYTLGPYIESTGGTGDVQSETTGRGIGFVLRDGAMTPVVWSRPTESAKTTFTTSNGHRVGLAPGRTWVELMTDAQASGGIHFTP
jgi:hypothetical protein